MASYGNLPIKSKIEWFRPDRSISYGDKKAVFHKTISEITRTTQLADTKELGDYCSGSRTTQNHWRPGLVQWFPSVRGGTTRTTGKENR